MTTRELFQVIRKSPAMYLAPPSATTLRAFLSGVQFALQGSDSDILHFQNDFGNWLRKRYNLNSSQHWTKIIEFYSSTEDDEMNLFWKLLDEFESKPQRKQRRASSDQSATARL
jgi:hypothetical protein